MNGVDTVFHLAALIGIPYSYESPTSYIRTNVDGSVNVFKSLAKTKFNSLSIPPRAKSTDSTLYTDRRKAPPSSSIALFCIENRG